MSYGAPLSLADDLRRKVGEAFERTDRLPGPMESSWHYRNLRHILRLSDEDCKVHLDLIRDIICHYEHPNDHLV